MTLTRGWEQHPVLSQRDTGKSTLEDQLPALIRALEIGQAEADWARKECGPNSAADMLLCDTGVLLAAGNVKDHYHAACLSLMRSPSA